MKSLGAWGTAAAFVFGAICASPISSARADIVWNLSNLQFVLPNSAPDGGTLNGTFTINVYGYNGPVNITTTTGVAMAGDVYTGLWNSSINNPTDTVTIFLSDGLIYQRYIQLTFANPLTVPGVDPIVGGAGGPSFECNNWSCSGGIRYLAEGSAAISAVPEPSSWAMMVLGFAAMGVLAFRRKTKVAVGI
ncbi:PEP-CTERM sorting domain-containing protein [Bradyrhizobium sp. INPA01-394B]|uniref:PEP-CTERM sorting domain-containing protein n=1 Tax=Bradyrhizobium campsiandrae TaxID=1729892 RepID=A0ABR7UBI0_9BRAD|nr:PEP-CTERM sorting domain-containing protein [Bradyrhizobium campsiandrae]MBC9878229.1 PEP-CTERM sorting domain-containing protein [Bradyrhizobium campsiandrae]MBC9980548.1 PEP-CTERM sorting domain-containing protein [Bradyrhizobium campsiandrae]